MEFELLVWNLDRSTSGILLIAFPGFQAKSVSEVVDTLQLYLLRAQMLQEIFVNVFGD